MTGIDDRHERGGTGRRRPLAARIHVPGEVYFEMDDGEGLPSRWNTLRAMRVLRWYDEPRVKEATR